MATVVLQYSAEKDILSRIICWLSWSRSSHVDIVLPSNELLGARYSGGVQIRKPDYGNFKWIQRYYIQIDDNDITAFWQACFSQLGKPYDLMGIFNFFIGHRNWRDTASWFCSEYVEWVCEQIGIKLLNTFKINRITPGMQQLSPLLKVNLNNTLVSTDCVYLQDFQEKRNNTDIDSPV